MCGLDKETIEYIFNLCPKAQLIWSNISSIIKKNISFLSAISSGLWLSACLANTSVFMTSIIAAGVWFMWKTRCNLIFQNELPNYSLIACRVFAHVKEFSTANLPQQGKCMILNNFSSTDGPFLFLAGIRRDNSTNGAAGFIISNYNSSILMAGCCPIANTSRIGIDAKALLIALQIIVNNHSSLQHIFITSKDLQVALNSEDSSFHWQVDRWVKHIKDIIHDIGNPEIHVIPHNWNAATHRLAIHGLSLIVSHCFNKEENYLTGS